MSAVLRRHLTEKLATRGRVLAVWRAPSRMWDQIVSFFRRAAIWLVAAVFLILWSMHAWISAQFPNHPVFAGLALAILIVSAVCLAVAARTLASSAQFRDATLIFGIVLFLLVVGLVLTSASTALAAKEVQVPALRVAMLWASACFMGGFLAGFLFGVPRVTADTVNRPAGMDGSSRNGTFAQRPNTNLEQISDWLTKIIVGLGLVELKALPSHIKAAARWVAEGLTATGPPTEAAVSFAGSLILYFSILGFLGGYLLTLLFLAGAFGRAGREAYGGVAAFGDDAMSDRIRNFWRPRGGSPDPVNTRKLVQWIKDNLPEGTSITDLISTKELDKAREKAVADLNIP
jgi:hypothetical protein